jgi:hypothetical protein
VLVRCRPRRAGERQSEVTPVYPARESRFDELLEETVDIVRRLRRARDAQRLQRFGRRRAVLAGEVDERLRFPEVILGGLERGPSIDDREEAGTAPVPKRPYRASPGRLPLADSALKRGRVHVGVTPVLVIELKRVRDLFQVRIIDVVARIDETEIAPRSPRDDSEARRVREVRAESVELKRNESRRLEVNERRDEIRHRLVLLRRLIG